MPIPVYPDHAGRSIFISQNAIPIPDRRGLRAQHNPNINMLSGATYTSQALIQSPHWTARTDAKQAN